MNIRLHNDDLRILQAEARTIRFGKSPAWIAVDWKPLRSGANIVYLRQAVVPNCSVERTDIRIEAPPNLYEPVRGGLLAFYRNIWVSPGIRLFDRRARKWVPMPRLHPPDKDGFAYLCVHPDAVVPGRNILDFIKVMDLFFMNPGYKAELGERV